MILIDLSKAFDSLSHNFLLRKLQDPGTSKSSTKWFESYLAERYQTTRIGCTLSSLLPSVMDFPKNRFSVPYCSRFASMVCRKPSEIAKLIFAWTILSCFFPWNRDTGLACERNLCNCVRSLKEIQDFNFKQSLSFPAQSRSWKNLLIRRYRF